MGFRIRHPLGHQHGAGHRVKTKGLRTLGAFEPAAECNHPSGLQMLIEDLPSVHCIEGIFGQSHCTRRRCRPRIHKRCLDQIEVLSGASQVAAAFVIVKLKSRNPRKAGKPFEPLAGQLDDGAVHFDSHDPRESLCRAIQNVAAAAHADDGRRSAVSQLSPRRSHVVPQIVQRPEIAIEPCDRRSRVVIDIEADLFHGHGGHYGAGTPHQRLFQSAAAWPVTFEIGFHFSARIPARRSMAPFRPDRLDSTQGRRIGSSADQHRGRAIQRAPANQPLSRKGSHRPRHSTNNTAAITKIALGSVHQIQKKYGRQAARGPPARSVK